MSNNQDQQFNNLEEKLKEKHNREKFEKHETKISGKSVFELQRIITEKHKNLKIKEQDTNH